MPSVIIYVVTATYAVNVPVKKHYKFVAVTTIQYPIKNGIIP